MYLSTEIQSFYSLQTKLQEGNVFTCVCLSTRGLSSHNAMGLAEPLYRQTSPSEGGPLPQYSQPVGGTHPTGMHICTCSKKSCVNLVGSQTTDEKQHNFMQNTVMVDFFAVIIEYLTHSLFLQSESQATYITDTHCKGKFPKRFINYLQLN